MSSEYPSPAKSRDQSPWRVFKGRRPWAQAAQAAGFGARPRVSRVAATLPFRDGLPFPAGVHSIYACLNFQVVHHLFPRVCHLHYPAIARIVEQTAVDHGLEYHHQRTLASAVAAHLAWLRAMGQPPAIPAH